MTTYPLSTLAAQVTSEGIILPTYADILASLQASYRSIFGSDVVLDASSQDGQWLAVIAKAINDCNQTAEAVYNSYSPATAIGTGLSNAVKLNGISRLVPSNSTVPVLLVGQAYSLIDNGVVQDANGYNWELPTSITIPAAGQITVTATCATQGAIAASAGSVKIVNPTYGWQTAAFTVDATQGAPVESDGQLRQRQEISTSLPALTPLESIVGVVANLNGVGAANVVGYQNDTNTVNSMGIPGHTISIVVNGGVITDIANAIASKKNPGTGSYGTTSQVVEDKQGVPNTINFFIAAKPTISVAISIKALSGFLSSTKATIQSKVSNYISGLGIGAGNRTGSGKVYLPRVSAIANLLGTGLESTFELSSVQLSRTGTGGLASSDVSIAFNEMAVCGVSDIEITVI